MVLSKTLLGAIALSFIGAAMGACPNACSGHGRCTNYAAQFSTGMDQWNKLVSGTESTFGYDATVAKKDSCTCFTKTGYDGSEVFAWRGADCSEKVCPFGPAFAAEATANNDHTQSLECSGKGECDRSTGVCKCYAGFTGLGCSRTTCPNDCSGKGECTTLKQMATTMKESNGNMYFDSSGVQYSSAFDATSSRTCLCDQGRAGADCSIVLCPSSTDVMGGKGSESGRACSGRGNCENGVCACYTGFFGTQCEKQRANVA